MAFATPLQSLFIKRRNFILNRFRFQPTNESQHMFQSIMKIRRPFLTDDLCLKVALMLNYESWDSLRWKVHFRFFN